MKLWCAAQGSRFKDQLFVILQHGVAQQNAKCSPYTRKTILCWSMEDEFRSLTAWGKKLLCSLVVRQQILLYHLPDAAGWTGLFLGWVLSFSFLWALCRHLTSPLCDADSQEPETVHLCHLSSIDVDRGVCLCLFLSKIIDQLLGFVDTEQ